MGDGRDEHGVVQWICCLCVHGDTAHVLGRGSICSVWQLSIKTQLTAPTLGHFGGELLLSGPWTNPSLQPPYQRREELPAAFPAALDVQQCLPHPSCQDLFLEPWCLSQALKGSQSRNQRGKKQQQTQDMRGWFRWKQRMTKVRVALGGWQSQTDHSLQP